MRTRLPVRRPVLGAFALLCVVSAAVAEEPLPRQFEAKAQPLVRPTEKSSPAKLLERAAKAERLGDYEAAFAAYCELPVVERSVPEVREKLNAALRRVQQLRRHRDPGYQQFATRLPSGDAVNLFSEVATKVPGVFADAERATPQHLWTHGIEELDRALASPAFRQFALDNPASPKVAEFRRDLRRDWMKRPVADAREARSRLKELLAAAHDSFAIRVPSALAIEVVSGACSGLDEYTVFLNPSQLLEPVEMPNLAAYGLAVRVHNGQLIVDAVQPGSWITFHAPQLYKGVALAKVNSRRVVDHKSLNDALASSVNGVVELEVAGATRPEDALVRLPVQMPTVWHRVVGSKDGIGYIRIGEFQPGTPRDLDLALNALRMQDVRAIVLDLRGNRGGSFTAAVESAKRFLPTGLIVTTQGQLGEVADRVFSSDFGMRATDLPLVVMVDSETASAAEIVAAAIRDNQQRHSRSVSVGMPTFGKGTIQYPLKLGAADDSEAKSGTVRLTIAKLITPNGTPLNGVGVTPDVVITDPARQWEVAVERAIELLQPMMQMQ
jgi:carboxyl-terminal processing protease